MWRREVIDKHCLYCKIVGILFFLLISEMRDCRECLDDVFPNRGMSVVCAPMKPISSSFHRVHTYSKDFGEVLSELTMDMPLT